MNKKLKQGLAWLGRPRERFRRLPQWVQQFSINVFIGMSIVIWIQMNADAAFVKAQQNRGLDWLSRLVTNTSLAPRPQQPLFMVNVDAETYTEWQEPWLTPADKIAALVERMLQAAPAQLVVDFDFSRRSDLQPLLDVLVRYTQGEAQRTHLVFMKTQTLAKPSGSVLPGFRDSELDSIIAKSEYLHWAAPLFRPDSDGVIRNWQLIVPGCEGGKLKLMPSVQLLSVLLHFDHPVDQLEKSLVRGQGRDCSGEPAFGGSLVLDDNKVIDFSESDLRHRIIYALPPAPKDGYLPVPWKGVSLPALTQVSAHSLLATEALPTASMLQDAIVIIGATHPDSGDIHQTPLGAMPGSLILANSIVALQGLDQVERPPLWLIMVIEFVLVLGTSWFFLVMSPYTATFVSAGVIIVIVVPVSLLAFSQGVWIDFALPVLAVQLRSVFFKANDRFQRVRSKGLKGFL
ncbi:CHASE2 domain-containing protein [Alcanivorax sp. DP30]|uniref:CHASE2 domain-containing protein n=1 Tax=Alcanivorax sp. DP30 TaxID=2606217 RepID=UPI00136F70E3|nr:CHASE2 domain-containing protein [Alcanivorax sp. DP30]MZR61380.1 CHASE2 domain-containing protein [Alcanivorax sp. DP30]